MRVREHDSVAELKRLAKREKRAAMVRRLQVVILARQGQTAPQVVEATGVSRRTVQEWVQRYNAGGLEGLADRRRGGNRRHLSADQERQVCQYLDHVSADPHDGVRHGKDLRRWLERQFGVLYSLTGVYDLLHRLGYSCLMPRPRHAKADPQAQAAFKKTLWHRSSKSPVSTRTNASKSGSRTKPASANRGP